MALTTRRVAVVAALVAAGLSAVLHAQGRSADWPQWRGPNRDGAVGAFAPPSSWPEQLTLRWRVELGEGYASPVVVGNRVYIHTRKDSNEIISALNTVTGDVIWQDTYPAPYALHPAAAQHGPGPKSTPVVSEGKLFTFGISGILSGLDAATGRVLWRKEAPSVGPFYGTAMSPIVEGALLIAHVGGHDRGALSAFDTASGDLHWSWSEDGPGYGSPVMATFGGTRQLVSYTQRSLVGIAAGSGELLWQVPFETRSTQNSVTPIVYGDLLISSGLEKGLSALRIMSRAGAWTTDTVWENSDVSFYMSSPVLVGDTIYGLSHRNSGQWVCVDARTGQTLWTTEGRQAANAAIVWGGDLLFLLNNAAELFVVEASPASFEPLRMYSVGDSQTWAHPALVGDSIFIKDDSTLAHWSLR